MKPRIKGVLAFSIALLFTGPLLAWMLSLATGAGYQGTAMVMVPMSLVFGFMTIAIGYTCRSVRLERNAIARLISSHGIGAMLTSSLWTLITIGWATAIRSLAGFELTQDAFRLVFVQGVILYVLVASIHYLAIQITENAGAVARVTEARVTAREAELRVLRSQIDPHFLFNSLNSISAMCGRSPDAARDMTNRLAEFFRGTLQIARDRTVPLHEEMRIVRQYLEIEKVRFGERLDYVIDCDDVASQALVPPLLLQPLAENAVKHGIATLTESGTISITCERRNDSLRISVANDTDPDGEPAPGTGTGLANLRQRIRAMYGDGGAMKSQLQGERFVVNIGLPFEIESQSPTISSPGSGILP